MKQIKKLKNNHREKMVSIQDKGGPICTLANFLTKKTKTIKQKKLNVCKETFEMEEGLSLHEEASGKLLMITNETHAR